MKLLYPLAKCLDEKERQLVKKHFACHSDEASGKNRSLALISTLNESTSAETAKKSFGRMFPGANKKSNERLAQRMVIQIMECLISETNRAPLQEGEYDVETADALCRKKSAFYLYLLRNKKDLCLAEKLVDGIIKEAKKYKLYSLVVDNLKRKRLEFEIRRQEDDEFDNLKEEIETYRQLDLANEKAYEYIALLIRKNERGASDKEKMIPFLIGAIENVKKLYRETRTPLILYYQKQLEIQLEYELKNYEGGITIAFEMLTLLEEEESVYTQGRVGIVYNIFQAFQMLKGNYDGALEFARQALKHFHAHSINYVIAKEWEFLGLFHDGKYREAENCAAEVLNSGATVKTLGELRLTKFQYMKANALVMQRKHEQAKEILKNDSCLRGDKEGYEFAWRVLSIMNEIELELKTTSALQGDLASAKIKALYDYLNYYENKRELKFTPRQRTIEKFFSHLLIKSFRFDKLSDTAYTYIEQLSSPSSECAWQLFSSELIPVHKWAQSKMKKGVKVLATV